MGVLKTSVRLGLSDPPTHGVPDNKVLIFLGFDYTVGDSALQFERALLYQVSESTPNI